jgi:dipeptide/tripeptide permease
MVPVTGVIVGYVGWQRGFTLAYVTLWIAFIHFVIWGVQSLRAGDTPDDET